MSEMVERVAEAIDRIQVFSRFNDWTSDKVEGFPVEICRYGGDGEPEIVVLRRCQANVSEADACAEMVSELRARVAIEAMREPTDKMIDTVQGPSRTINREHFSDVWSQMIDEALKPD